MSFWSNVKDAITDIATLEVLTFTGEISASIKAQDGQNGQVKGDILDWESLLTTAKAEGDVQLVAATKVSFDQDTRQFVATGAPQVLVDAHHSAVANATKVRQGMIDLLVEKVKVS